jgi:hypothetical protein
MSYKIDRRWCRALQRFASRRARAEQRKILARMIRNGRIEIGRDLTNLVRVAILAAAGR